MNRGFTTIELLITLGITGLLMALVLTYNRTGEQQIRLLRDQAQVVNTLLRAKSLAIQTRTAEGTSCGYGVHFEFNSYIIFKDIASPCRESDREYSGDHEKFEEIMLDERHHFQDMPIVDVLFIPPNPDVVFTPDFGEEVEVIIAVGDESTGRSIYISPAGQVTTQ